MIVGAQAGTPEPAGPPAPTTVVPPSREEVIAQGLAIFDSLRSGLGPHGSGDGSGELEAPASHEGR